jgi:hypothetical protein
MFRVHIVIYNTIVLIKVLLSIRCIIYHNTISTIIVENIKTDLVLLNNMVMIFH